MTSLRNPFRPTRFEHEQHPLIWISPEVARLEALKSAYVAGTRGSGKTSLLKSVNWRERLNNPTVREQLGPGSPDYVAVYFRLPDYLASALGLIDWTRAFPESPSPEAMGHSLFCQLIELVSAQLACEAFAALRAHGRFRYSVEEEERTVRDLVSRHSTAANARPDACSLDDLSLAFREAHQRLNMLLTRGAVAQAAEEAMPVQPGIFINELASSLRDLACASKGVCSPSFHIKICIDDCETLKSQQQRFLNTLVRNSRYPLFWVVSYVSVDYDSTNTIQHNQTLSDADRVQILLDEIGGKAFYQLCEQVSLLRIYYSDAGSSLPPLHDLPPHFFKLRDLLGALDVNTELLNAQARSISRDFEELVERSRAAAPGSGAPRKRRSAPPIYETYVLEKLGLRLAEERDENISAYLRRKQMAALLAIFSNYGLDRLPLVGAQAIVNMGDTCIRDYLELMGTIFEEAVRRSEVKTLADLRHRELPLSSDTQLEGVRTSSKAKFNGIRSSFERNGAEAARAIEFIGKLTARLQANHASPTTLATPERGNFHFDLEALDRGRERAPARRDFLLRLLRRCEADGLLRPAKHGQVGSEEDDQDLTFHVHRRFAAHFGFSHRGPYGLVQMPMDDFAEACEAGSDQSVDEAVAKAYARISREDSDAGPRLL